MMDFGFGRFLEMFEERFGKWATNALLAIIGLGVFAGCARLIFENILRPVFEISKEITVSGYAWNKLPHELLPSVISSFVSGIVMVLLIRLYYTIQQKRLERIMADVEALIVSAKETKNRTQEELNAVTEIMNLNREFSDKIAKSLEDNDDS